MSSELMTPRQVTAALREAGVKLSEAHRAAAEREGSRADLTGPVRDAIFGINSAVDALVQMIDEGRFGRPHVAVSAGSLDSDGD